MTFLFKLLDQPDPEVLVWVLVTIIAISESTCVRRVFVYLLMKLYKIFVQHNVEGL